MGRFYGRGRRTGGGSGGVKRERGGLWPASTSDTPENPQRCALTGEPLRGTDRFPAPDPILDAKGRIVGFVTGDPTRASVCFFLTCKGSEPLPLAQIEVAKRDRDSGEYLGADGQPGKYRCAPTGETVETVGADGRRWQRPVFGFQERTDTGWRWVACWDQVVLADAAEARGFRAPQGLSLRHFKGDRTLGTKHQAGAELTGLEVLASALDDEVDPAPKPVDDAPPA